MTYFWMRRDIRLHDNHGLYKALTERGEVRLIFIFDTNILDDLPKDDARVGFIYDEVIELKERLQGMGADLVMCYGEPERVWRKLVDEESIDAVYTNRDYEPYAESRDAAVSSLLEDRGILFQTYKDHVIFERDEVTTAAGSIYTVFTPYKRRWLAMFEEQFGAFLKQPSRSLYPSEDHMEGLARVAPSPAISLADMGFEPNVHIEIPSKEVPQKVVKHYQERRNFPGLKDSTSRLGIHFRFGTISIREKAFKSYSISETYLSELIWRDFYAQILANHPRVVEHAFREKYDQIQWREAPDDFEKWSKGVTGYPIVDAGMRELNTTGHMHNRVRMITASFLTKHLLIDWRKGEAYFAAKLLDFDLASNNGGWQWASGSGTDAAPYFRIFNPTSQMEKFDKQLTYIKEWVPEYGTPAYPLPMVDHKFARERCLAVYKAALSD